MRIVLFTTFGWLGSLAQLGDPERKMASNAGYLLSSLLTAHPNMKVSSPIFIQSFPCDFSDVC